MSFRISKSDGNDRRRWRTGAIARATSRAWLISPYTGWKWAKWPSGHVGWLPSDLKLPPCLRVPARNDIQ